MEETSVSSTPAAMLGSPGWPHLLMDMGASSSAAALACPSAGEGLHRTHSSGRGPCRTHTAHSGRCLLSCCLGGGRSPQGTGMQGLLDLLPAVRVLLEDLAQVLLLLPL